MCEAGLLLPFGEKRGRFYRASEELLNARAATRAPKPLDDPYAKERS